MEFVDEAQMAHRRGEARTARLFFEKAFHLEKVVALAVPTNENYQLTRSVFLRSAATLALDCGFRQEAIQLIQLALSSEPHPAIEPELQELLIRANQQESLAQTDTTITGRLVAADLPNHQIKLQISDTTHLITVFVPEDAFTRIVRVCLKFVFGDKISSFFGETRRFLKSIPGRYGQEKQRSVTEKGAILAQRMKFKHTLRNTGTTWWSSRVRPVRMGLFTCKKFSKPLSFLSVRREAFECKI